MRPAIIVWLSLLPSNALPQGQACPCTTDNDPQAFSERIKNTNEGIDFEWFSDADKYKDPDKYCYERTVTNHHPDKMLRFDWPVGRLKSPQLSPNGGVAQRCRYYGDRTTSKGPLHYGRGNDQTDTTVWEGQDEPPPTPLTTILHIDGVDAKGERYPVRVALTSTVALIRDRFQYTYVMSLQPGSEKAVAHWLSVEIDSKTADQRLLSIDAPVQIVVENQGWPKIQDKTVLLFSLEGKEPLLTAGAPAYVPQQPIR